MDDAGCPEEISDFAAQAAQYVHRALGLELTFDSETLPILDHYLSNAADQSVASDLLAATAGAYYGEVVRRAFGGHWERGASDGDDQGWRLVLPGGLSFCPAGFAAAAMAGGEVAEHDCGFSAAHGLRGLLVDALEQMAPVSDATYYSLSGRFDTIEHLLDVLFAHAQRERERQN